MKPLVKSASILALCFALPASVHAQAIKKTVTQEEKPVEVVIKTLPPAYEKQMLELAETLGSLHYLRALCKTNEGQIWRTRMQALIDAEQPSVESKAQLIAHFNRGFRGYQEIYRECTVVAAVASNKHLKEGIRLAAEIPNRYGK